MHNILEIFAYLVVATSVVMYTLLDGFDLGVGALHLFAKKDEDRRIFLNAIGPFWDGNEVWLIIIGGALFAGFPDVYASLFSSFYIPTMILLTGIIFRVVAIEFRSKHESPRWRNTWDVVFCASSVIMTFCVGVVLGNLIKGINIGAEGEYQGTILDFFTTYPVLVGIMSIGLFMIHGLTFLLMKTEGEIHDQVRSWMPAVVTFFGVFYVVVSLATMIYSPYMLARMNEHALLYIFPLMALLSLIAIPIFVVKKCDGWAFLASCMSIFMLFVLFAIGTFPIMIRSSIDPLLYSLDLHSSAASFTTLKVFSVIVLIGIPVVIGYGFWIYRIFRGKVKLTAHSY